MKILATLCFFTLALSAHAHTDMPDFGPSSSEIEMEVIAQVNQGKMSIQKARPFFRLQDKIRNTFNNDLAFYCGKQAYRFNANINVTKINQSDEFKQCLKDFSSELLTTSGVLGADIEAIVHTYDNHMFVGTNNRVQFKKYWSNHKLIHSLIDIIRKDCSETKGTQIYNNEIVNVEYCTSQKVQKAVRDKIERQDIDLGRELNDRIYMAIRAVI